MLRARQPTSLSPSSPSAAGSASGCGSMPSMNSQNASQSQRRVRTLPGWKGRNKMRAYAAKVLAVRSHSTPASSGRGSSGAFGGGSPP